jgi:nicotinamide riboside kinase
LPKRAVLTGPESTGKTSLALQLACRFKAWFVPEYARHFMDLLDRPYTVSDLQDIELGQKSWEQEAFDKNYQFIVQDTDLLTILIWYSYKFGIDQTKVREYILQNLPDQYLLCFPDIEWIQDPQRENPNDREVLFEIYEEELQKLNANYVVIRGSDEKRIVPAIRAVSEIF